MVADTQERRMQPSEDQVEMAVQVFGMLADSTRIRLVWALLDQELPVNELAVAVSKPAAGVSQHLAKLRMARVVRARRQANQMFYRIENHHVRQLVEDAIYHVEHATEALPEHHRADEPPPEASAAQPVEPPHRATGTERVTR
jgi:DNA-binding transcriptional ArsR family regulator